MRAFTRLQKQLLAAVVAPKPHVPEAGVLVWGWFIALHEARSYGQMGPNPISHGEIEAYARIVRLPIEPRHVELLRAMDAAWMNRARQEIERAVGGRKPSALPPASTQAMSPALFDAMFG